MSQALGGFLPIPLQVTQQSGVVIDHAESKRRFPLSAFRADLPRCVMEIQMPEATDELALIGPDLAIVESGLGRCSARCMGRAHACLPGPAPEPHVADHRGIGGLSAAFRMSGEISFEIVRVQLPAPASVVAVVVLEPALDLGREMPRASRVGPELAAQAPDRILVMLEALVIPALDRGQ